MKPILLFISPSLGGGGAERVMTYIINYFSQKNKYEIKLLLLQQENNTYLNDLSSDVNVEIINLGNKITISGLRLIKRICQIKPDLCFVGYFKLNILLSFFIPLMRIFFKCRFIARETCLPNIQYSNINSFFKKLICNFYNKYDVIIAQSEDMKSDLINFGINKNFIHLINNPVDISRINRYAENGNLQNIPYKPIDSDKLNLIAIGRLSTQKNYELLLKRISEVKGVDFILHILGKGPLETKLKNLCKELNLDSKVLFHGFVNNPYPLLNQCYGLILSSNFEGFPNVLLEANALGKPILSNNCKGGINEIIIKGINGFTCDFNNPDSFSYFFEKFLTTPFDSDEIKTLTKKRYSLDSILTKYDKIFIQELNRVI